MNFQSINASASPEVQMNENFDAANHVSVYGKRHPVTTGLTWGYWGGRWGGFAISDGTISLTNNSTNYLVVARATGVLSASTATTNWNNTREYARVYRIVTLSGVVSGTPEDHRAGLYGAHGTAGNSMLGKHAIPIMAAAMRPTTTNGCDPIAALEISAGQPEVITLDFDATTSQHAQFSIPMPKSWNEGTVTFEPIWSHSATATNFGVVWELKAVAVSNDDAIGVAFGTGQTSTDTGGTTNDLYVGPESSAITIGGSPVAKDVVFFDIARLPADGSDTLAVKARLHGIVLYITTDAETDD